MYIQKDFLLSRQKQQSADNHLKQNIGYAYLGGTSPSTKRLAEAT